VGCSFCKAVAPVVFTSDRWDDAAVAQPTGDSRIEIPSGAHSVHLVYVSAKNQLHVAMDGRAEVYSTPDDAALNEDGAPIYLNWFADYPVVVLPVPEGATYLHMRAGSTDEVYATFYGETVEEWWSVARGVAPAF